MCEEARCQGVEVKGGGSARGRRDRGHSLSVKDTTAPDPSLGGGPNASTCSCYRLIHVTPKDLTTVCILWCR